MARRYLIVAAFLALLGVLGMMLSSPMLGVFETTPVLNALHLAAAGAATFAAARGIRSMRAWGQALGYGFAALAVAGFAADADLVAHLLPLSDANAWLHLALALMFLYHALLAPPTL